MGPGRGQKIPGLAAQGGLVMRVLITGAASGLGYALAKNCLARGDHVCALDIAAPDMQNPQMQWILHDMGASDDGTWDQLAAMLCENGPFDLVIQNAGINATGAFETVPLQQHLAVLRINLSGPIWLTHLLLKENLIATGGRLVLVSSLSHFTGYPGAASYAASKDGLASLAVALRKPLWSQLRVRVHLVCPGPMDTPHATRHAPPDARSDRRIAPDRVARLILAQRGPKFLILPGAAAGLAALLGRAFPQTMTRVMGRVLFQKLK